MMLAHICIGLIIGMLIGRFFREPDIKCPRVIRGYNCNGYGCDHRKSELYRSKMDMALVKEERHKNYWGGGNE